MSVEDIAENASACLCPDCPTYNNCMGGADEKLYCARGRTACEVTARRCVCPDCPVWSRNGLSTTYFCTGGAAE